MSLPEPQGSSSLPALPLLCVDTREDPTDPSPGTCWASRWCREVPVPSRECAPRLPWRTGPPVIGLHCLQMKFLSLVAASLHAPLLCGSESQILTYPVCVLQALAAIAHIVPTAWKPTHCHFLKLPFLQRAAFTIKLSSMPPRRPGTYCLSCS